MSKTLYLECTFGISGDMFVGSLLDLGADEKKLEQALASLPVKGFHTCISRVKKSGLDACDFAVMYKIYKLLQSHALEEFEVEEVASAYCVGANVVDKKFPFYKLFKDAYVGGETEANRVLELISYCSANGIHLPTKLEDGTDATVDVRDFLAYLDFAKAEGYIAKESEDDLKRYFAFMQVPAFEDNLKLFEAGTISSTELKAMCNISEEFEASLGIEKKKDPFDIAKKFALAHHYIEKEDELSNQLLQDVIVSGAEDIWLGYDSHAISEEKLLRKFGFELGIIPPNYFFVSTAIDTAREGSPGYKVSETERKGALSLLLRYQALLLPG